MHIIILNAGPTPNSTTVVFHSIATITSDLCIVLILQTILVAPSKHCYHC